MGKPLNQQRRGKGSPVFTAPSHLFKADVVFREYDEREKRDFVSAQVVSLINDPARSGVVMGVRTDEGKLLYLLAPEGIALEDSIRFGTAAGIAPGNVIPISQIPDGTPVYNIELTPGDGGKLVRAAGGCGYIVSHLGKNVYVRLPSKAVKILDENCRAQIGVVSVGGRLEQPFFKAGKAALAYRAKAKYWPHVRGVAMSAYDHPFGGKQHHPGRSTIVSKGAPPGQKVGLIGAGSVGRGRGKKKVV